MDDENPKQIHKRTLKYNGRISRKKIIVENNSPKLSREQKKVLLVQRMFEKQELEDQKRKKKQLSSAQVTESDKPAESSQQQLSPLKIQENNINKFSTQEQRLIMNPNLSLHHKYELYSIIKKLDPTPKKTNPPTTQIKGGCIYPVSNEILHDISSKFYQHSQMAAKPHIDHTYPQFFVRDSRFGRRN